MSSASWTLVNRLFLETVALHPSERAAFLAEACGDDQPLRDEIERLLAGDMAAADASFLAPITHRCLGELAAAPTVGPEICDPFVGTHVGPYEIATLLGVGGMGRVYRAVRREVFSQTVAIKLLKRGMDSDELLRRFQTEILILAELGKHPNIAALMDAGLTADDRPYLVMEYVDGMRIDRYCDQRNLSTRERLDLFLGICDAVQYAHQRTVIHRDLKPCNVLVTADGQPKLIDFGIAKLTSLDGDMRAPAETRTEMRVFTPNYASPEQAAGRPLTTASDVYSLGVLLYELLSGQRPYEIVGNSASAADAILATEPKRPSVALAASAAAASMTRETRRMDIARPLRSAACAKELTGDLDNIVQMAMRKDPNRRYATVAELAEDIRRHLNNFPVHARPETFAYHCNRFLRRHRVAGAAVALVAITLAGGILGASWQWQRAESEARTARAATAEANRAAQRAQINERAALWQVYRANIALAATELQRGNVALARQRLDACPPALRHWEWRYFDRQLRKDHGVLQGHDAEVSHVMFLNGGADLLAAAKDGTLRTWDVASGRLLSPLRAPLKTLPPADAALAVRYVATAAPPGQPGIRIWDVAANRFVATVPDSPATMSVDGSGTLLATLSPESKHVRLWNMADGRLITTVPRPADGRLIALDDSGSRLAYSCDGGAVLWDVDREIEVAWIDAHEHAITALAFNGDGSRMVSASTHQDQDRRIRSQLIVWNARDGAQAVDFGPLTEELRDAKLNRRGDRIATTATGGTLRLWDAESRRLLRVIDGHRHYITSFEFSPNDRYLVSTARDLIVRLWDGRTGERLRELAGHDHWIATATFSPDSPRLASGDSNGDVRVWQIDRRDEGVCRGHTNYVYAACWLGDSGLAASGSWDGTVRIWDAQTCQQQALFQAQRSVPAVDLGAQLHPNRVVDLAPHPDGRQIAALLGDGSLHAWDLPSGAHRTYRQYPFETWRAGIAFVPTAVSHSDSRVRVSGLLHRRRDGEVILWNSGGSVAATTGESNAHGPITDGSDGAAVAIGALPATLIQDVAVGPTGSMVALALDDGNVRIWQRQEAPRDGDSPSDVPRLPGEPWHECAVLHHGAGVNAVQFSPDGKQLASGGDDRRVRIWDVAAGSRLAELPHATPVFAVAFTPDGTRLATGSGSHEVQLWDTVTWDPVAQLSGHTQYVHALEFSPDGSQLLSASGDGTLRIWSADVAPVAPPIKRASSSNGRARPSCFAVSKIMSPPCLIDLGTMH